MPLFPTSGPIFIWTTIFGAFDFTTLLGFAATFDTLLTGAISMIAIVWAHTHSNTLGVSYV
jgi:hypothetical protein